MFKNIIIGVLCLTTAGAAGWGFYQQGQIKDLTAKAEQVQATADKAQSEQKQVSLLQQQIEQQRKTADTQKKEHEATVNRLNAQLAEKQSRLAALERPAPAPRAAANTTATQALAKMQEKIEQLDALSKDIPVDEKSGAGGKGGARMNMGNIAKMLKNNPAMREMVKAQQKPMVEMTYGDLYGLLNLPEDQQAKLKDILEKRQMDMVDVSLQAMDETLQPAEKQAAQKRMTEVMTQYNKEIEALLGKENNTVYKTYEETQAERMQMKMFSGGLPQDQQLSEVQQNELIFELHKARKDFKFTTGLEKQNEMPDFSKITSEQVQRHLDESRLLNAQYVKIAEKTLNPTQLVKFKESLEQQIQMQEMGMRMFVGEGKKER